MYLRHMLNRKFIILGFSCIVLLNKNVIRCVNKEECKFTVQTQLYLSVAINYMFWLCIAIIGLNADGYT